MDEAGELLVSMLTGFASAAAPDGSLAVLRLTYSDGDDEGDSVAVQIALRPEHVREMIEVLIGLEAKLLERTAPKGRA